MTNGDRDIRLEAHPDLLQLLQGIVIRAREVTKSEFSAISVFGEHGHLDRFVYSGMDDSLARRLGAPPVGRGLLGELADHSVPVRLDDLTLHPRFTGWPAGHPDMCAFLGVPITADGRTIGSLYMTRTRGGAAFSEEEEIAATVFGLQVALGVSTALAHQRSGRVAVLEERIAIAHDLHDGTIQTLYALALEWDTRVREAGADPTLLSSLVHAGVARVNGVIAEIREYIAALEQDMSAKSPDLSLDIPYVVRQLVPEGIGVITNIAGSALQNLSARESEDLLFIAREAVSNAVRHGEPSRIGVDLRQTDVATALTIQDNGIGFDQFNARTGLGTITMRTRAQRLGAEITVLSMVGMGTTVRVLLPRADRPEP